MKKADTLGEFTGYPLFLIYSIGSMHSGSLLVALLT